MSSVHAQTNGECVKRGECVLAHVGAGAQQAVDDKLYEGPKGGESLAYPRFSCCPCLSENP